MAMSHCACIVRDAYVRGLPPPVRNLCCRMCRPCKTRCVDLPSCALTGPILRSIECCVLPARRVGRKRTLRARRRGLYAMWCSALYWRVWSGVDLSGGALGARVTNRKRVEQNTFQMLSAQVHALAQQLEQFKSRKPRNPRARPRRKVQASRPSPAVVSSPSGVASPDGALYNQLLSLFQSWKSPNPPSDAQVRAALMGVLSPGPSQSPEAVKPQKPQSVKPQSEKPPSWAHLFAGPSNAPDPKPPRRSLYGPAWSAKVIQFAQLKDHALDADLVISCASDEEAKSKDWLLAHGYKHKATLVIYDADETDTTVLFNSNAGPVPAKAKVVELQPSGPSRKALPAALKDDKAHDVDKTPTCFMRLTLSRNFAAPSLFSQVKQRPQCLPAVVLQDAKQHVLQTRAAITYDSEATCLVQVKESKVKELLALSLPPGCFLNRHKSQEAPYWIAQTTEQSPKDYWSHVLEIQKMQGGRLVYRASKQSQLGLLGMSSRPTDCIQPRWLVSNVPHTWQEQDITQWATERGFVNTSAVRRHGKHTWFIRAHPPTGVSDVKQAFTFSSGITVGPAKATPSKSKDAVFQAGMKWGALPRNQVSPKTLRSSMTLR